MAAGDFAKLIQPRVTNKNCESCGSLAWDVIEETPSGEPIFVTRPNSAEAPLNLIGFRTILMICQNCRYYRTYAIPTPPEPNA